MSTTKLNTRNIHGSDGSGISDDQESSPSPKKLKVESKDRIGRNQHRLWKKLNKEKKLAKLELKLQQNEQDKNENVPQESEKKGRDYTVSIAVPGSILDNAQSSHLRTYVAGQVARAAAIFKVDEVVVFDDMGITRSNTSGQTEEELLNLSDSRKACFQMARILQYLECPQYLRKYVFPIHKDLENAGILNPLDSTHHFREHEECDYREGCVTSKSCKNKNSSFVYIGLKKDVLIDKALKSGVRVTIKLQKSYEAQKKIKGTVVAPHTPRTEGGFYWGYNVRLAHSIGAVFAESPYTGGYDLTVGTSEKGASADDVTLNSFRHLLIVFGGLKGIEASLDADEGLDIGEPELLFDHYLNMCPGQGSRTIRTEEAILISLALLRPKIESVQNKRQ